MSNLKEQLIDEIIANARRDRARLEAVADGLVNGFADIPLGGEADDKFDPEIAAAFAEEISKIGDSLSKINHELVELVKLDSKKDRPGSPVKLDEQAVEEAYDAIQPEEVN